MDTSLLSDDEAFHNCFFYFLKALDVLAQEAAEQCEIMDNSNVAWEIQHDVLEGCASLINWPIDYLSLPEKSAIAQLTTHLKALPDAALVGDCRRAMNHPAWSKLRSDAIYLIAELGDAIRRNGEFFQKSTPPSK